MQVMDEKARLFGKINIIDLAVIVIGIFFIIFLIIFLQLYKYPKPVIHNIGPTNVTAGSKTKVQITGYNFGRASIVYFGDIKISDINVLNDRTIEIVIPDGLPTGKYDVKVANSRRITILPKGITINPPPLTVEKWLKVKVKFPGLPPELDIHIKEGSLAKDASEKTVGKILKIISREPSKIMTFVGSYKLFNDPVKKDIIALYEILTVNKDSNYYYQNQIVKINSRIKFAMELLDIEGLIIDIEN